MSEPWVDRPPEDWDRFYRQMEDLEASVEFDRDRCDREFEMAGRDWLAALCDCGHFHRDHSRYGCLHCRCDVADEELAEALEAADA